jgi:hypothetical protein
MMAFSRLMVAVKIQVVAHVLYSPKHNRHCWMYTKRY